MILEFSLYSDPDGLIQTTARVSDAWAAAHGTAFVDVAHERGWRVESRYDDGVEHVDTTSDDTATLMQILNYEDAR